MFMMTFKKHGIIRGTYQCNDINTAADIIYGETGNENDYERMKYILGNMKFDEMFHGKDFVIQCYKEDK